MTLPPQPTPSSNLLEEFLFLEVLVFALQRLHKELLVLLQEFVDLLEKGPVLLLHGSGQLVLHLRERGEGGKGGREGEGDGREGGG